MVCYECIPLYSHHFSPLGSAAIALRLFNYLFEVGHGHRSGKRHFMLIRAMVSTSDSVRPRPYGFGARRRAYSPSMELRNGRISSVWEIIIELDSVSGMCRKQNTVTYADGNWMVVFEVVSYMMIVQRLHRLASMRG